ncbi:ABC transporter permease [Solihabitans fulvus]|uniref:ABC transporter permease n=1 Tax=Solihabitans fulvus TaxID=1892852 RepID=A0A5B2WDF4_9PSEU|nr:ABC transporter permease [Solihabitans fulvus]KAA2248750.1 ABC transporter permease [Solihabitans fulvus]
MKIFAQRWLVFLGCLVVWQFAAASGANPYFPPPLRILRAAGDLWFSGPAWHLWLTSSVGDDILPSLARLLIGWAVAAVIGVLAGIALGRSAVATDYVAPLLSFARAVPPPLLVPVFLVVFGIGPQMEVATIVLGVVWPILLNTIDGARSVDAVKVETARAFRITRSRWILGVVLPSALPKVFAGLRVSLALSLILMVVSELVGSTSGIGFQLVNAQQATFDYPAMWAWIALISVLGYVLNGLFLAVERRVLGWHHGYTGQAGR